MDEHTQAGSGALRRLVRRLESVVDHTLHRSIVSGFLEGGPAIEVVDALRELMSALDLPGHRQGYLAVVHFFLQGRRMPYKRIEALYRAAAATECTPVRYLLLRAPPLLLASQQEVVLDPELLEVPLGVRKSMARTHDRDVLLRLATDPTPSVVEILLTNPLVTEPLVLRMVARRPNRAEVITTVAAHPRWSLRYSIQHAIAQNPYSPTSLAAALVPFTRSMHTLEIANDGALHPAVREVAQTIREWRAERRRHRSQTEVETDTQVKGGGA